MNVFHILSSEMSADAGGHVEGSQTLEENF